MGKSKFNKRSLIKFCVSQKRTESKEFSSFIFDQRNFIFSSEKMDQWITLRVGATKFRTTRATLASVKDTFFITLLLEEKCDSFDVNRDPTHFRHILNFLRDQNSWRAPTNVIHA